MASRNKYRQQYLRWHATYQKRALTLLLLTFKGWLKNVTWSELTPVNYQNEVSKAFQIEDLNKTYFDIYVNIGLVHGQRVGKSINVELKAFTFAKFLTIFEMNVGQYLRTFGVNRIVTAFILVLRIDAGILMHTVRSFWFSSLVQKR